MISGKHGRRTCAAAFWLVLTGIVTACGGGGGGGGGAPMVTLSSIAVTPANPSIALGTTTQLTATGTYSDSSKKDISSQVTWVSATPTVATVSTAGLATSKAVGTSSITASLSGVTSGGDTLTVTAATIVSIAITPANATISPNSKPLQFTATAKYTDGTVKDLAPSSVTWKSSVPSVAAIGPTTGSASPTGIGSTVISATHTGGPSITSVTLVVSQTVYAYATNFDASPGTVSQYKIGTMGALTPLSPPTVAAGTNPFSVSVEPTGQYVYVANYMADTVSQYLIGSGGLLTPVGATGTVATGKHPNGVTIDPLNKHAYVANFGDNTVSQYDIGTTGELAPMTVPTVGTGLFPASIVVSPDHKYAYVANYACSGAGCTPTQGTISEYTVGTNGALTLLGSINTGTPTSRPNSLIVDPASANLYVANAGDGTVSQFTIGLTGALTLKGAPIATGTFPFSVTVDPFGRYLYVANTGSPINNTSPGTVSQFLINPADGTLSVIGAGFVAAGKGTSSVAVDPTGLYAYATNRGELTLSQYSIGGGGALTLIGTVPTGLHPTSIALGY